MCRTLGEGKGEKADTKHWFPTSFFPEELRLPESEAQNAEERHTPSLAFQHPSSKLLDSYATEGDPPYIHAFILSTDAANMTLLSRPPKGFGTN